MKHMLPYNQDPKCYSVNALSPQKILEWECTYSALAGPEGLGVSTPSPSPLWKKCVEQSRKKEAQLCILYIWLIFMFIHNYLDLTKREYFKNITSKPPFLNLCLCNLTLSLLKISGCKPITPKLWLVIYCCFWVNFDFY